DVLIDQDWLGQQRLDGRDVGGVHLLGRVPPEAVHAERDQVVEVGRLLVLHVRRTSVQVGQAVQFAVPHLGLVVPVGDRGVAGVEVGFAVQRRVVVLVGKNGAVVSRT